MPVSLQHSVGHVLMFSIDAWGHVGPLCGLAARIVQAERIHVTFLSTPGYVDRIKKEISRHFISGNEDLLQTLVRVIGIPVSAEFINMIQTEGAFESFTQAYDSLVNEKPLICSATQSKFDALPAPRSIVLDIFCVPAMKSVRNKSGRNLNLYLWYSGAASFIFPVCAPKSLGGNGDRRLEIHEEALRTGKDLGIVAHEVLLKPKGEMLRIPGFPPVYDYELQPQQMVLDDQMVGLMWMSIFDAIELCDGVILSTSEKFEPAPVSNIRKWFNSLSKTAHTIGPLLPVERSDLKNENNLSKDAAKIEQFMDSVLKSRGEESLLYISFGSFFWSTEPEKIWAFLDVVMEKNIPFIMSHGSPLAVVPDEVKAKVEKYSQGMLTPWSPQQAILAHPVTGWFLSHGGQNSTIEAVTAGVPMILWPYHADQPFNAIHLTENLDAGYELIEVRNGDGLKPRCRTGTSPTGTIESVRAEAHQVLSDAFGASGKQKRANMKALQEKVLGEWQDGGASKADFEKLIQTFIHVQA
ncbi:UDP-Glycosyltransferase/glycogen phosphorylase [Abortiporus biennis]|nr:UDP-Glycosyltransferase/glycogen phosphorylase [Abortiporus biennis]